MGRSDYIARFISWRFLYIFQSTYNDYVNIIYVLKVQGSLLEMSSSDTFSNVEKGREVLSQKRKWKIGRPRSKIKPKQYRRKNPKNSQSEKVHGEHAAFVMEKFKDFSAKGCYLNKFLLIILVLYPRLLRKDGAC